ncbi:MAG: extracellular solute-binding protein [Spirochaetes bacterium]|nr:extracellular solute-binding protein [Spirochaetota bacterium]
MKRFSHIAGIAALALALASSSCQGKAPAPTGGGTAKEEPKKLYIFNWTYYTPDSVIEKFEKEFGVDVVYDVFDSNETMYSKLEAGGAGYDIVFPSADYVTIMAKQGMLQGIDKARLANWKNVDPGLVAKAVYDPGCEYSVPYYMGASGVAVNRKAVGTYDKSWSVFARKDLKGKMCMLDDMREVLGDALKFKGMSVNETDPAKVKAAADLVAKEWKPNLLKFDAEAFGKSFAQGEVVVAQGYAEVIFAELEETRWGEVDFFIPKEGGPLYIDSMVLLKGSKNVDLAYKFMDFIHRPEIYAEFCDYFRFPATANVPARGLLKTTPHYTVDQLGNCELKLDLGEDLAIYNQVWQDIKVGK